MEPGMIIFLGTLFGFAVLLSIKQVVYNNKNPYRISYYKWDVYFAGDPAWPVKKIGWCTTTKLQGTKHDVPEVGDTFADEEITKVDIKPDGKMFDVDIYIGNKGETNIDAYDSRRKFLIDEIGEGKIVSKEERKLYDLL